MPRVDIRPPDAYWDWPEDKRLEWIRALMAEIRAAYEAAECGGH